VRTRDTLPNAPGRRKRKLTGELGDPANPSLEAAGDHGVDVVVVVGSGVGGRMRLLPIRSLGHRVVFVYLLLAAPVASAALFWGEWAWMAASVAIAVVEYATLRRSQRFSARVWRSLRVGRRSSRERATESVYVVTAVAGVALLAIAVLGAE
jgi:hypothetical protein